MSKRTERRAAERAAHKAQRFQTQATAQPSAAATPVSPQTPPAAQPVMAQQTFAATASATGSSQPIQPEQPSTASEAQINANRENAKSSTGPVTEAGKKTVSQNHRTHGLTGRFAVQTDEILMHYYILQKEMLEEFNPQTHTECRLTNSIVEHYWLMLRAIRLQERHIDDEKKLSLFLRYQATHERSYYKAVKELQNLQKQARKEQIGFESQKLQQEAQEAKIRLANAKAEQLEVETSCRQVMQNPMPGTSTIGFEQLAKACSEAIATLVLKETAERREANTATSNCG